MTTFPRHPSVKGPAVIADHGRQVTRAHARLDEAESKQAKHTAQIATANTNIATNTANITTNTTDIATNTTDITTNATGLAALNTRLGGSTQETYLSTLAQATAPSNPAHSGIGTLGSPPTAAEFNALNTAFNNAVDTIATLLSRLGASNILT